MRFNSIFNLSSLLAFTGLAYGSGYRMSFYGLNGNRPSDSAIPACGTDVHYDTDYYIALNQEQYTASQVKSNNPNTATVCDKCVKISYQGKWVVGRIVDSCPGCPYKGLDVSPTIFEVFADRDVGILYMDWEFTDCSLLGKSGSGGSSSSSKSSSGDSDSSDRSDKSESDKKESSKKTTRETTTYVNKKNTRTTSSKHYTVITTKVSHTTHTTSKSIPTSENQQTNVPKLDNIIVNSTTNSTTTAGVAGSKINKTNTINNTNQNQSQNQDQNQDQNQNKNQVPVKKEDASNNSKSQPTVVEQSFSENKEEDGPSYALPITGALAVTGAAGIALVYVKRDSKNVNALKEKFPEAFSNIKRSISRGSTAVKRSLSQSGRAIKRSLSMSGNDNSNKVQSNLGPRIRTKKEYRASLDAHYPLQGVQLYDPPVPSATHDYYYIPQYNTAHYNNTTNNNEDDSNLRIDFIDS